MTKKGKNGDKLQYGQTLCVLSLVHYLIHFEIMQELLYTADSMESL